MVTSPEAVCSLPKSVNIFSSIDFAHSHAGKVPCVVGQVTGDERRDAALFTSKLWSGTTRTALHADRGDCVPSNLIRRGCLARVSLLDYLTQSYGSHCL